MKQFLWCLPLLVILAACGESQATNSAPIVKPTPTVAPPHFYDVGQTVTAQPWEITLKSTKLVDPATYPQHDQIFPSLKPDDRFLILDEHVKNISSKQQNIAGMQFVLQDKDGNSNFTEQVGIPDVSNGIGGDVAATMEMSGQDAYIVPSSVHLLYWVYNPQGGGDQIIWKINL